MPRVAQSEIDQRRRAITELLRDRSYLPVGELCRRFKISQATARRDLVALSRGKNVVRTFGGAMADYDRRFAPFADRLAVAAAAKGKIAAAAAARVESGMTVFLDAGTTLFAVADRLRRVQGLTIVTNSLAVAERLAGAKDCGIHLLGGQLLVNQSVLLGSEAERAASRYRFDWALLGAQGFDSAGLWNSTEEVVALQRVAADRADHFAVLADATKASVTAAAFLLPWDDVDVFITDAKPGTAAARPAEFVQV